MFLYPRKVQLYETDLGQVVHHSNYWRYLEEARHEAFQNLNAESNVYLEAKSDSLNKVDSSKEANANFANWVVYDVEMKYMKPLRHLDHIAILSRAVVDGMKVRFEYLMFQTTAPDLQNNLLLKKIFNQEYLKPKSITDIFGEMDSQSIVKQLKLNMNLVNKSRTDIVLINQNMQPQRIPQHLKIKFGEKTWTETWL